MVRRLMDMGHAAYLDMLLDTSRVLLDTPHGSNLYGTATPTSDEDRYIVLEPSRTVEARLRKFPLQLLYAKQDVYVTDVSSFMMMCDAGVPQALEALKSRQAIVDNIPWRHSYRVGGLYVARHLRAMRSMHVRDTVKGRRHAARIGLNLRALRLHGTFNPTLSEVEKNLLPVLAELELDELSSFALS